MANVERGVLLFNMHHIASDGWSMALLVEEFIQQYQALADGQPIHCRRSWITGWHN
jgi:hypothetical protein